MPLHKSPTDITAMAKAGRLVAECHRELRGFIAPGVTTGDLDGFVEGYLARRGAKAEQKGYRGYPYATCTSVNDEICHGFPSDRPLALGDLVKVDFVANLGGWLADSCWCYGVGELTSDAAILMKVAREALYLGISQARAGNRIGDIGEAIQTYVEAEGYSVVRDFTGHGIGRTIHEGLWVPHFGQAGRGRKLEAGMVLTIEPMVNAGSWASRMEPNGWTARTKDGSLSAQFEHTIAVTGGNPIILTEQEP